MYFFLINHVQIFVDIELVRDFRSDSKYFERPQKKVEKLPWESPVLEIFLDSLGELPGAEKNSSSSSSSLPALRRVPESELAVIFSTISSSDSLSGIFFSSVSVSESDASTRVTSTEGNFFEGATRRDFGGGKNGDKNSRFSESVDWDVVADSILKSSSSFWVDEKTFRNSTSSS